MRITAFEVLHAHGGHKPFSFLKLVTDEGLVGWSEFSEFIGTQGLSDLIRTRAASLVGRDPCRVGRIAVDLEAQTRVSCGGLNAQANAALENACLDIRAKSLEVPVSELFGGALRDRLPVYWSHCGTYRARSPEMIERPPVRSLSDLEALGAEVAASGFKALKTNVLRFDGAAPRGHSPGFGIGVGHPELNLDGALLEAIVAQMTAFRRGAGPAVGLMLDLNFNFKPEGLRRIARALEPLGLTWLEMDSYDAKALGWIRAGTSTPIGSLEAIPHRRQMLPFLEQMAVDFAIIDPMWNGFTESIRMAALADTFGVNVNSHAFSSPLALMMGAQMCATLPNCHMVEMDVDQVPWAAGLFTEPVLIEAGELVLPQRPGWGLEPDEAALRRHAPTEDDRRHWLVKTAR